MFDKMFSVMMTIINLDKPHLTKPISSITNIV